MLLPDNFKNIVKTIQMSKMFRLIRESVAAFDGQVYVVGGWVRNMLLDKKSKDIDFVVVGDVNKFADIFISKADKATSVSFFKNFGTVSIKTSGYEIEMVGARKESYRTNSRNPDVEPGNLDDDLLRRDFTVNAFAVSLNEDNFLEFIDHFDGLADLNNKVLRTPNDPDTTFSDDPLRIMRAIRFATQLNFTIDDSTADSIIKNRERLSIVSMERISDELNKIILSSKPSTGFLLLHDFKILDIIFPELTALKGTETVDNRSHKDNFHHTLQVLDNIAGVSDNLWLRWAALLHDIGKPPSKKYDNEIGWTFHSHEVIGSNMVPNLFRRLHLPLNEKMKYVRKLVFLHLRPIALTKEEVTDSAIRRLIVDAANDLDDLLLLCRADVTSKNPFRVNTFLQRFDDVANKIEMVMEKDHLRNWENPVKGELIMQKFNIPPSKTVGIIKEAVKEAILEGTIKNNFEEAEKFMINYAKSLGLIPHENR